MTPKAYQSPDLPERPALKAALYQVILPFWYCFGIVMAQEK
jgi:hypothetical protein